MHRFPDPSFHRLNRYVLQEFRPESPGYFVIFQHRLQGVDCLAQLSNGEAMKQLYAAYNHWYKNFADADKVKEHPGFSTRVGNNPHQADTIYESFYNKLANQWCSTSSNTHKKRATKTKGKFTCFREADASLSGGSKVCHLLENWGSAEGQKFIWHFRVGS